MAGVVTAVFGAGPVRISFNISGRNILRLCTETCYYSVKLSTIYRSTTYAVVVEMTGLKPDSIENKRRC